MNILIEIVYKGWETEILRKGNFPVNIQKFKSNPDRASAEVALKWINQIRREANISKIISVKYDNIDITDKVCELDNSLL